MKRTASSDFSHMGIGPPNQYGAICWRKADTGLEILLITSRETGRWVIPKGWPINGKTAAEAAAREAWEEAGVVGKLGDACLGVFSYDKIMPADDNIPCVVALYGVRVDKLSRRYPEQGQRKRKWFAARTAATLVNEPELSAVLLALDQSMAEGASKSVKTLQPAMVPDQTS